MLFSKHLNNSICTLVESGSEVSRFIPKTRKFAEVTILQADVKKVWLKATLKDIKHLIKNHTFLMHEPDQGETMTPCMDVYKANIKSYIKT